MLFVVLAGAASVVGNRAPGGANIVFTTLYVHLAPGEALMQFINELLINSEENHRIMESRNGLC